MNSIPASQLVNVIPGVLGAGGNPLALNAVFLTEDPSIPVGTVQPFSTASDVSNWFGPNAIETQMADVYFSGFIGANQIPGLLFFTQYNANNVAAYLRSGSVAGLTLTQLQALSGVLDITVDGNAVVSANINLSAATSFSNAAALITTGLDTSGGIFSGTGSISGTTLTITAVASGALSIGDVISGAGVTAATSITALGSGTGGTGTYTVNNSQTVGSEALTVNSTATCTYDSLRKAFVIASATTGAGSTIGYASGSLSAGLNLTLATGAVLSQGAAAATPAGIMSNVVNVTQNWASFMTVFEPILSVKLAFAAWLQSAQDRYEYVCWDSDVTALAANATGSFGFLTKADDGVVAIWNPSGLIAAFNCGVTASINFNETNGRITYAYKGQAGLVPDITNATVAANLIANGYSFYGAYATANQAFQFYQDGHISGDWVWQDPFTNQIYFNSQLQLALMELLANVKSLPYNNRGYGLVRAACLDPIAQMLNFGAIQPGVTLSAAQAAEVNNAAGIKIDTILSQQGWYLQILDANSITRGLRGSPPMTLWYTDGGSIQKINLTSIDVE